MTVEVLVYASWYPLEIPTLMGRLSADYLKGRETHAFEFETTWLSRKQNPRFGPDLPLARGRSFPAPGHPGFGIFSDAAPDRWGRRLMMRREQILARQEKRPERTLLELDFILGVDDTGRMGALRFKRDLAGPYLHDDRDRPTPPMTALRALEHASTQLDNKDVTKVEEALGLLLRPGSSLGGARPKANVVDPSSALWIAKFPSPGDDIDVGGWEQVAATLAKAAGITMAESKAVKLGSKHHTFLTKRFDRSGRDLRHVYASAMTLLGRKDGESHDASYLDIAEALVSQGASPSEDLRQLWRRIVFSILIANTDDHLRNHGFLYDFERHGWRLSPAFDINPSLGGGGLSLAIDEQDHALDLDVARSVAPYFQVSREDSDEIINQVLTARKKWRAEAKRLGIKSAEIDLMASVFDVAK